MSKLSSELRLMLSRKLDDEWDLESLLKLLGQEIHAWEKYALVPTEGFTAQSKLRMDIDVVNRRPY